MRRRGCRAAVPPRGGRIDNSHWLRLPDEHGLLQVAIACIGGLPQGLLGRRSRPAIRAGSRREPIPLSLGELDTTALVGGQTIELRAEPTALRLALQALTSK